MRPSVCSPDYANAYENRGNAKVNLDQYQEAIADFDEAIRLQPDYAYAYANRGNAKVNLGQYQEAIADFDEAIRLQPDNAYAYADRGLATWVNIRKPSPILMRPVCSLTTAYANRGKAKGNLDQYQEGHRRF